MNLKPQYHSNNKPIIVTAEIVEMCATEKGGFSRKSVAPFGLKFPLVQGWKKRLVGTTISKQAYEQLKLGTGLQLRIWGITKL
jgi:hypothetical protein